MCLGNVHFGLTFWGDLLTHELGCLNLSPSKFSAIISLNRLSSLYSYFSPGTPVMCRLFLLMVYCHSCRISSLFSFFLLLFYFDRINSSDLSFASQMLSSVWCILVVVFSIAFFILYFSFRISVRFSSVISISLLNFSFCSCIVFLICWIVCIVL